MPIPNSSFQFTIMFPPVDDHVLENNPDFARLYKTLITSILNPDGSSRRSKETKENEAVQKVQLTSNRLHRKLSSLGI